MTYGVLLAAGYSFRFGEGGELADKLLLKMPDGRSVQQTSFDLLSKHPKIDGVIVVCREGRQQDWSYLSPELVVVGGSTRLESCYRGVLQTPERCDLVVVHDAARPLATLACVNRVVLAAQEHGAALPVVPVSDTLKKGKELVEQTIPRSGLYRAQTPQAARRDWLINALSKHSDATDEAMALEAEGYSVCMVAGDEINVKITTQEDWDLVLRLAGQSVCKTGFGFDVHPFSSDDQRPLKLGGVVIPDSVGLDGHSDADVLLHAIVDAIFGALGAGDIGEHFSNQDAHWQGADSQIFVREACKFVEEHGYRIVHIDTTILAERPRVDPYRSAMRDRIASVAGISSSQVNVKATTAEGMGAIGRCEGIAAMAVVTIAPASGYTP
jgi:2-C-methyl-D-erythritol 4-phosphate cytidylyltransferase/2-C-methyl-D-erythritol 2,4-cyclodiphosphate synthase